jgi:predicted GNAT family N-acyltransferase
MPKVTWGLPELVFSLMGVVLYVSLLPWQRNVTVVKTIIEVKQISSNEAKAQAFAIRMRVFVREQHVPASIELDRDDARALHFLATSGGRAVGTARVVLHGDGAKIGRMAVLKTYRRKGIGRQLLKRAIAAARRRNARKIYLHAQVPVIGFYQTMGFRCVGSVFDEAGIPHRKMILQAKKARA